MNNNTNYSTETKNKKHKKLLVISGLTLVMFLCILISTKIITKKSNNIQALNDNKPTNSDTKPPSKVETDKKSTNSDDKKVAKAENDSKTTNNTKDSSKTATNNGTFVENSAMTIDKIWTRDGQKIAFLTFDDGPTEETPKILDILDKYNIKATFFILGTSAEAYPEYLKEEVKRGHAIANHSYSHNIHYYGENTPDAFVQDILKCDATLKKVLGQDFKTNTVRFPGGSFNHASYKTALNNAGFKDIDWNIENGDATRLNVPKDELIANVKKQIVDRQHAVILMHDSATKQTTVESLPEVIEFLRSEGFKFGVISQNE